MKGSLKNLDRSKVGRVMISRYRSPWEERVPTAVTEVILGRVISHNSSQMDSPEIKSASQTVSWGGNIPVQFFIDLHSISSWQFPPALTHPSPPLAWSLGLLPAFLMMSCTIFIISGSKMEKKKKQVENRKLPDLNRKKKHIYPKNWNLPGGLLFSFPEM